METKAQRLLHVLKEKHLRITFAESCTGGMLASQLTALPGCSDVFPGGFVTYGDQAKIRLLGVSPDTVAAHTVYSEEVAKEMAVGAAKALSVPLAIGITGIAGPGGALPQKPVGTVSFGYVLFDTTWSDTCHFTNLTREGVRAAATAHAIETLLTLLENEELL